MVLKRSTLFNEDKLREIFFSKNGVFFFSTNQSRITETGVSISLFFQRKVYSFSPHIKVVSQKLVVAVFFIS